jgi:hypothetical protein
MKQFSDSLHVYPVPDPGVSCEEILTANYNKMDLSALEDFMLRITSFLVFLNTQKDSLGAQIKILSHELNQKVYLGTQRLGEQGKYKCIDEKIALVLEAFPDVMTKSQQLSLLEAKFQRVANIPFSISKHLEIIKAKYYRRLNEEKKQPNE